MIEPISVNPVTFFLWGYLALSMTMMFTYALFMHLCMLWDKREWMKPYLCAEDEAWEWLFASVLFFPALYFCWVGKKAEEEYSDLCEEDAEDA